MKVRNLKKALAISIALPALAGCHVTGSTLLGGHDYGGYSEGVPSTSQCTLYKISTSSGSTLSCQVPDSGVILNVTPSLDGLHVIVRQLPSGAFATLSLSYQEHGAASPHSVALTCARINPDSPNTTEAEILCKPNTGARFSWFESSSLDVKLELDNLQINDPSCGSMTYYYYSPEPYGCTLPDDQQAPIGNVAFPSLYLTGGAG
jgi:hypothetical protein